METKSSAEGSAVRRSVFRLAGILWYGLLAYLALIVLEGPVYQAARGVEGLGDVRAILSLAGALLGLALLVAFFHLVAVVSRWAVDHLPGAPPARKAAGGPKTAPVAGAFPTPITLVVGAWLVLASLLALAGLVVVLSSPEWLKHLLGTAEDSTLEDVLVTALAGAVGGSVSTILAYLAHASEEKDFEAAYIPWYLARPLLGLLLGLISFFLIKGGLLATIPQIADKDFNNFGLAGIGSLVGMFSKNAVEKLKEVFHTVFSSRTEVEAAVEKDLLKSLQAQLPAAVWEEVAGVLKPEQGAAEDTTPEGGPQEAGAPEAEGAEGGP